MFEKVNQSVGGNFKDKLSQIKTDDEGMDFVMDDGGAKTCRNKPVLTASTIMDNIEKYRGDLSRRS